jgi:hypothetical protein
MDSVQIVKAFVAPSRQTQLAGFSYVLTIPRATPTPTPCMSPRSRSSSMRGGATDGGTGGPTDWGSDWAPEIGSLNELHSEPLRVTDWDGVYEGARLEEASKNGLTRVLWMKDTLGRAGCLRGSGTRNHTWCLR